MSLVARLLLVAVFFGAAVTKVGDPDATVRAVRAYRLLGEGAVRPVAYALPYLELGIALLLLIGIGIRFLAGLAGVLLVVFIGAVASAGLRGLQIDCGCFGGGGAVTHTHYLQEIGRDVLFLLAAAWLVWRPRSPLALDNLFADDADLHDTDLHDTHLDREEPA